VKGEPESPMDKLGDPAYPDAPMIEPEDENKTDAKEAAKTPAPAPAPKAGGSAPPGATAADVSAGETIFTSTGNCFTCHGQGGTGTAMAPALNDAKWIHIDGSWAGIQKIVNSGVPQPREHPAPMPAKGGAALSDQQVKQVAAYVFSLSH
jgi:mono/diheme cytochrome c family protein